MSAERIAALYLGSLPNKTALTPLEEILASVKRLSATSYQIEISTFLPWPMHFAGPGLLLRSTTPRVPTSL